MADGQRRLLVVRHGERCDYFFRKKGVAFSEAAFRDGAYRRFNKEAPSVLPVRSDGYRGYSNDTPITERGYEFAVQTGRLLSSHNIHVDYVYASPAFRCVQTADAIIKGLNLPGLRICIEPGLFQWAHWCRGGVMPQWMTVNELSAAGFPVDVSYAPITEGASSFDMSETLADYYNRSFALVKEILKQRAKGVILLVAHAGSLDTLTRQLAGGAPLGRTEFSEFLKKISYLSVNEAIERADGTWKTVGSPIQRLHHGGLGRC